MFFETIIACLFIGAFFGFVACSVFVADPLRRSRNLLRDRVIEEQMRTYAAQARLAAFRAISQKQRDDNDRWSRKATDLKAVQ